MEEYKLRSNFKYTIGETFISETKNITILNRFAKRDNKGRLRKFYQYKCNICGWNEGIDVEYDLVTQKYCSCCLGRTVVEGINDIPTTAPWMIDYFQGGYDEAKKYTKCSGKVIVPICPYCGKMHNKQVRIITLFKQHGFGCECISDKISYPEKFIIYFLKSNNINYIYQLTKTNVEWACKYRYDFYLPDYNTIIEVHGGQHYKDSNNFSMSFETQKETDSIKKQIAINNKVQHYIELDCSKSNIKHIVNSITRSNLLDILQLSGSIDWNQCDLFAQSNLIKEVCDYYKNIDKNTTNIATYFGLHVSTICRYLKKGEKFGWCVYNSNIRKVEVFDKNGTSIGIFDSAEYIVKNTDYGYNTHSIRNVCRGINKRGLHNGYQFRYVLEKQDS